MSAKHIHMKALLSTDKPKTPLMCRGVSGKFITVYIHVNAYIIYILI